MAACACALPAHAKNAILFVADGLRAVSVTPEAAPTLASLAERGVRFANSHALFPTVTTANASAIATGHYLGDTGDYANTLYFGFPLWSHGGAPGTFLESDAVLGELNSRYRGNYLSEMSLLAAARRSGYATAVVGKIGAAAIQDVGVFADKDLVVIDDVFGRNNGLPVPNAIVAGLQKEKLENRIPDAAVPNVEQQTYLADVVTRVLLPQLKQDRKSTRLNSSH